MPVTITFHRLSEKQPSHGEDIIWLQSRGSFGYTGFEPRQIVVEYSWQLLEGGEYNGTSCCYESPEDFPPDEAKLVILLDGNVAQAGDLWCSVDDYWKCLGEEE